ncbi:MAG: imelysin family protein [Kaistella sp.]
MKKTILNISVGLLSMLAVTACRDTEATISPVDESAETLKKVVQNNTNLVIIATYNDLNEKAIILKSKIANLTINNVEGMAAAKTAWVATRAPWEESEGFLYGPVDLEGIDPAIDTWPVDISSMNAILNSSNAITPDVIASNPEARGFHLIEFLLWGENGNKTAAQLTAREIEYLKAASADLQNNTQKLYDGWIVTKGNFANNFLNPTPTSSKYKSYKDVLVEMVNGLVTISDEVGNGKIEDPLNGNNGGAAPAKEESRFSNNSKRDFSDNIKSVKNIYLGGIGQSGLGISTVVASKNNALDIEIKSKIDQAINAIDSIPGTFSTAIYTNRPEVIAAQNKVRELQLIIEQKLVPLISTL